MYIYLLSIIDGIQISLGVSAAFSFVAAVVCMGPAANGDPQHPAFRVGLRFMALVAVLSLVVGLIPSRYDLKEAHKYAECKTGCEP